MTYNADWGNTPAYKAHVEAHGSGDTFTNDYGYPQEPVNSVLWAMLGTGVSTITEKNVSEVYARLKFHEIVFKGGVWGQRYIGVDPTNPSLSINWEDYTLTPEHVAQCVNLRTNNSTESRSAWVKRVVAYIQRDRNCTDARELYFGKSMTPTKCINVALDSWKLEYEASVQALAHTA